MATLYDAQPADVEAQAHVTLSSASFGMQVKRVNAPSILHYARKCVVAQSRKRAAALSAVISRWGSAIISKLRQCSITHPTRNFRTVALRKRGG